MYMGKAIGKHLPFIADKPLVEQKRPTPHSLRVYLFLPCKAPPRDRSARLRWFHRADITGSDGDPEPTGSSREQENSVNQAFRRCTSSFFTTSFPHVHPMRKSFIS